MVDVKLSELDDGNLFVLKQEVQKEIDSRKKQRQDKAILDFRCAFASLMLTDVKLGVKAVDDGVRIIGSVNDFVFNPKIAGEDN